MSRRKISGADRLRTLRPERARSMQETIRLEVHLPVGNRRPGVDDDLRLERPQHRRSSRTMRRRRAISLGPVTALSVAANDRRATSPGTTPKTASSWLSVSGPERTGPLPALPRDLRALVRDHLRPLLVLCLRFHLRLGLHLRLLRCQGRGDRGGEPIAPKRTRRA